jgi:dihydroorotase
MRFDLLIRGGEVIDPGGANEGRLDVAVTRGRIAAVDGSIPRESASRVIDADGMFVTPGLVDLHTHVYRGATYWGLDPDPIASRTGVTTWADAGSAGALTLPGFREFIVERSVSRIKAFLNISMIGLVGENHESANLSYLDTDLFRRLVDEHRDLVVGVKVRMGTPNVGENGIEPLRRARRAADECGLPLMVHVSVAPPSIEEVLALMRPGDILTHCCTGLSMRIVDENGQLFDFAKRAWDDGVVMDTAHGSGYSRGVARRGPPTRHDLDRSAPVEHQVPCVRPSDLSHQVPPPRGASSRSRTGSYLPACRGPRAGARDRLPPPRHDRRHGALRAP